MRPALVWGCTRYPSRSRATISERTVAEETCTPGALATWDEPTGSALPMYSVTTASRMAAWRSLRARASASAVAGRASLSLVVMGEPWHSSVPSARPCPPATPATSPRTTRVPSSPAVSGALPGAAPGAATGPATGAPSVVEPQRGDERLLRYLDPADVLHPLLALFLLLQQFALAGDVTPVALGEHVLALGLDRLAGHDAPADGGLNGHIEHLPRDELTQLVGHAAAVAVGRGAVDDGREGVAGGVVDQDVDPHQIGRGVVLRLVIEAGVALGPALELIEEVQHHLGQGDGVDELHPLGREVLHPG